MAQLCFLKARDFSSSLNDRHKQMMGERRCILSCRGQGSACLMLRACLSSIFYLGSQQGTNETESAFFRPITNDGCSISRSLGSSGSGREAGQRSYSRRVSGLAGPSNALTHFHHCSISRGKGKLLPILQMGQLRLRGVKALLEVMTWLSHIELLSPGYTGAP